MSEQLPNGLFDSGLMWFEFGQNNSQIGMKEKQINHRQYSIWAEDEKLAEEQQ